MTDPYSLNSRYVAYRNMIYTATYLGTRHWGIEKELGLTLAQSGVDSKTNEIGVVHEVLKVLKNLYCCYLVPAYAGRVCC
jgi:hypothetical protein